MKTRFNARTFTGRGAAKPAAGSLVPPVHPRVQRSSAPSLLEDANKKHAGRIAAEKTKDPVSKAGILSVPSQVANIIVNRMERVDETVNPHAWPELGGTC